MIFLRISDFSLDILDSDVAKNCVSFVTIFQTLCSAQDPRHCGTTDVCFHILQLTLQNKTLLTAIFVIFKYLPFQSQLRLPFQFDENFYFVFIFPGLRKSWAPEVRKLRQNKAGKIKTEK